MSAIFGIFGNTADLDGLSRMRRVLKDYGRQASDTVAFGGLAMGCNLRWDNENCRLEEAVRRSADGRYILVADAQVYNREELIAGLPLNQNATNNDLLLAAYLKWGDGCALHVNGAFAFAVFDTMQNALTLFSDHLGVRPLYYFRQNGVFAFASSIPALLALPFVPRDLDELKLYAQLTRSHYVAPGSTLFEAIKSLPQAHSLTVRSGMAALRRYWRPGLNKAFHEMPFDQAVAQMRELVRDAVKIRMRYADDQAASDISGGVDSSVISVLAARAMKERGETLRAISWSLPVDEAPLLDDYDERKYIMELQEREGFRCDYLPHLPIRNEYVFHGEFALLGGMGLKAVLSGWGGDEALSHRCTPFELLVCGEYGHYLKELAHASRGNPLRFAKQFLDTTVFRLFRPYEVFWPRYLNDGGFLARDFHLRNRRRFRPDVLQFSRNPFKHVVCGTLRHRAEIAARIGAVYDKIMLFPFLDYRLVDLAISLPRHYYLKNGVNRFIFRTAFRDLLTEGQWQNRRKDDPLVSQRYAGDEAETRNYYQRILSALDRSVYSEFVDLDKLRGYAGGMTTDRTIWVFFDSAVKLCAELQETFDDAQS